jgi:transposase
MNRETVTLSQRELQRVEVISRCIEGHLACARAAELLDLSPRQIKRLKARYRLGSAAALAHANRGRPSHRRWPLRIRQAILRLARTRYAGFNDHHLCEKLNEQEGFSLSRETLRRLLRTAGIGSPRKRRPPAHRQRRLRSAREGELVQLDGSPHAWLQGRGPLLTALGMQDDASGKILAAQFFSSETSPGYFRLLQSLLRRFGVPLAFYGDRSGVFVRNDEHWSIDEQLAANASPLNSDALSNSSASPSSPRKARRPKGASSASGACCRIVSAANCAWRAPAISPQPTASCAAS